MSVSTSGSVLVVGAGPVGLTLALLLHQRGVDVTVIDRDAGPVEQSRAIWVHSRTLEIWDTIGMTALVAAEGRPVTGIQLRTSGALRAMLPYDGTGATAHPHGVMLEQSRTQTLLLSLLERGQARVQWNTTLEDLAQVGGMCRVTLSDVDGHRSTHDAAFVVGADGGSSTVRRLLGIELLGGTYDSSFFLADIVARSALDPDRAQLNFHGRSTVAVLPLPGEGRYRLVGNLLDQSDEHAEAGYGRAVEEAEVEHLVAANHLPVAIESIGWTTTYRSHYRVASTFRMGRALLVGDAGHLHSPAGGLGMNTGVADAANLAWKLADVLGGAQDELLDTYDQERRSVAHQVIATSDRLFVLQTDPRRRFAFARRNVLPVVVSLLTCTRAGRSLPFRALSGTSVRYRVPGRQHRYGRLATGRLLPLTGIPAVDDDPALHSGRHLLLIAGGADREQLALVQALAGDRGWRVVRVQGPDARRLTRRRKGALIIWIRPDRYIGWIGSSADDLETMLRSVIGSASPTRTSTNAR
ncbi:2-polyprenyl-6-methoxyphenol hydroxylase-like FAD-dependent oxidoreductase [Arthrobacter sp. CAN_A212]|uniref:FAD-dependent oxidoreductase n=1 Tax=Arthrobacter sp. CAN_A212 TaxID=2787719 RepID=UPI0018CA002B